MPRWRETLFGIFSINQSTRKTLMDHWLTGDFLFIFFLFWGVCYDGSSLSRLRQMQRIPAVYLQLGRALPHLLFWLDGLPEAPRLHGQPVVLNRLHRQFLSKMTIVLIEVIPLGILQGYLISFFFFWNLFIGLDILNFIIKLENSFFWATVDLGRILVKCRSTVQSWLKLSVWPA